MPPVIRTERLTKSYGDHRGITELDLEVAEGEIFGFLGPNGAGKTTTMRVLLDLIRPTSGRAEVFGIETTVGSGRDPPADRLPARRVRPVRPADRRPDDHLLREPARRRGQGVRRGARRAARPRPEPPVQGVLEGQQAEGRADRRAPAPARPADPRRADVRARPARPADVLRHRPRGARRRPDDLPVEPHHRRGRPDLRPGGDHPRGPAGPGRLDRGHPPARLPPRRAELRGAGRAGHLRRHARASATWWPTGDTVSMRVSGPIGAVITAAAPARHRRRRQPRAEPRGRLPRPVRRAPGRPRRTSVDDHVRRRADLSRPGPWSRVAGLGTIYGKTVRDSWRAALVVGGVAVAVHDRDRRAVRVRAGVLDGRAPPRVHRRPDLAAARAARPARASRSTSRRWAASCPGASATTCRSCSACGRSSPCRGRWPARRPRAASTCSRRRRRAGGRSRSRSWPATSRRSPSRCCILAVDDLGGRRGLRVAARRRDPVRRRRSARSSSTG